MSLHRRPRLLSASLGITLAELFVAGPRGALAQSTWQSSSGGSWVNAALWDNGVPNSVGATATFNNPNAAANVKLDTASLITIGGLTLNNNTVFARTFSAGAPAGQLVFDNTGSTPVTVTVNGSSSVISTALNNFDAPSVFNDQVVFDVTSTAPVTGVSAGSLLLGGLVSGPGGFTKTGPGLMTVAFSPSTTGKTKTYTGPTVVNNGRMRISGGARPLNTSSFTVEREGQITLITAKSAPTGTFPEGIYRFGASDDVVLSLNGVGPSTGPHVFFGAVRPDANIDYILSNRIYLPGLTSPNNDPVHNPTGTAGVHMRRTTGTAGTLTFTNAIDGPGSLTLTEPAGDGLIGVYYFKSTASTYAGGTIINAGTLDATQGNLGAPTGPLTVNVQAFGGASTTVLLNVSTPTTTGTLSGTHIGGTLSNSISINNPLHLTVNQTADGNYEGALTGAGGFTLGASSAAGKTLTFSGANTYAGNTAVDAATLLVTTASGLPGYNTPGKVSVAGGATLAVAVGGAAQWNAAQVDALRANASLGDGSNLGFDTTTGPFAYASNMSGGHGVKKLGAGTLTLSGVNAYTGGTTVVAGTLLVTTAGGLPGYDAPGKVAIANGATLAVAVGAAQWDAGQVDTLRANASLSTGSHLGFDTTAGSFNYSSNMSGGYGVKKLGTNTLTLSGVNTYTGGTTVEAGLLVVGNVDALAGGALTVTTGGIARAQPSFATALTISTLATAGSGQFDITDNSLVIRGMTPAQVQAAITSGAGATGAWTGPGINSGNAAADANHVTAVGFASNGVLNRTEFKGVSGLTATDVLVKYTYYGDSDLNGATTLDDYTLFLNGYQTAGNTWVQGDYDYSGLVTLDDFTLFLAGYQQQGAPLSELKSLINSTPMSPAERSAMLAAVQAVPEPAALALLGAAAGVGLLARRHGRRLE
jgi:autotransporter-associated beta strand protein